MLRCKFCGESKSGHWTVAFVYKVRQQKYKVAWGQQNRKVKHNGVIETLTKYEIYINIGKTFVEYR